MKETDFKEILKRLRQSPEAMPWDARRGVVRDVSAALTNGDHSRDAIELMHLLASDPKWEIRADVANSLLLLPEEHFAKVAAVLADDTNGFVRRATERAIDRRRRGLQTASRARREFNQVQSQYAALEKLHGKAVADKTRKLAERLFDHMVGATVHEMRGILTPLMAGTASLLHHLDDGRLDPAVFREQLKKSLARLTFLERLVEDMRTYSQPPPTERRRERLADLVESAAFMVRENFDAQERQPDMVAVMIDVPGTLVVEVSRHLILIAIANVLKNAYEAFANDRGAFQPGVITISAKPTDEDTVEIAIRDNGMGICREDLEDLLDFTPGKTTKKNYGTGFGLPIAQRNVAVHGGSIGLASEVDVGTTVTIFLPIEQATTGADDDVRSIDH